MIRNNGSSKPNFRVADKNTAERLLKDSKPKIPEHPKYSGSTDCPNKTGLNIIQMILILLMRLRITYLI